jgi:hypothetical protein
MKLLSESSSGSLTKNGKRWQAVLAVPGQGSSGFYSETLLKEFGPVALAPGAKAFIDHDSVRSPKDMIGVYPDGAWWDDEKGALVGELEVFPHWQEFVEAVGPHAGLSIYMMGETDSDGNVVALHPDRMNGVDLVSYPGLVGSGLVEKLYESAHRAGLGTEDPATDVQDAKITEGIQMEKEELLTILEGFKEEITAAVIESVTPAEEEESTEEEVTEVADMAAVAEAAIDAGIPAELRAEIYEAAKGLSQVDALALVEARKNTVDAIRKAVTESVKVETATVSAGRVVEAGTARFDLTQIAKVK